jgi:hypothetical protein
VALLLTKSGRVELARSWHRDLTNANDYYHFTLGKTTAWPDEESPDTPEDSEYLANEFRRNIMFVQRLSSADVCHIARRIDWTSGTIYDPYDDTYSTSNPSYSEATTLAAANFYVLTDEFKVYKCLDNNSNAVSTVKPTSTGTSVFELADGYKWKFLFQISASDQTKFLEPDHIPVRKLTGNPTHDVNGEIDSITVTAGGSGYTSVPTVLVNGDGTGATATATLSGDAVDSITIDTAGSGYSFALITITGGGGTGATASVSLGDADSLPALQSAVEGAAISGTIDRIIVINSGQDYTTGDVTVTITGDGTGAEATATISAGTGAITGITVTNQGSGYTFADITFTQTVGVGTSATVRAVISPINGHGSNPIRELFGTSVAFVTSLSDNTNEDLILGNDFRQIGLVKNLYNYDKSSIWTSSSATACFIIDVDDETDYAVDDVITTADGGKFIVVQLTDDGSGTHQIYLQPIIGIITGSSTLTNTTQSITGLSINSVTVPEINVTTGDIVYIENRSSITRASDQVETIKALVNF